MFVVTDENKIESFIDSFNEKLKTKKETAFKKLSGETFDDGRVNILAHATDNEVLRFDYNKLAEKCNLDDFDKLFDYFSACYDEGSRLPRTSGDVHCRLYPYRLLSELVDEGLCCYKFGEDMLVTFFGLKAVEDYEVIYSVQPNSYMNTSAEEFLLLAEDNAYMEFVMDGISAVQLDILKKIERCNIPLIIEEEFRARGASEPLCVATNLQRLYGASCIFFPSLRLKIFEEAKRRAFLQGKSCQGAFIIPSSVHEILFMPDTGDKVQDLWQLVKDINRSDVIGPYEYLSDTILYIDSEGKLMGTKSPFDDNSK
jgi:hypothetical protein